MGNLRIPATYLLAMALSLSACAPAVSSRIARADVPREINPHLPTATLTEFAKSNDLFAFDLYRSLRAQAGNLILSAFSISLALAIPYAGARGKTEAQMARVLHFDLPQETLHAAFDQIDLALTQEGPPTTGSGGPLQLDIANAAWADQSVTFLAQYLDVLARYYGTGMQSADFIHQPEAARQEINAWTSQQTGGKIRNLIPQGALGTTARLVIVNAIYFKANWQAPFDPTETKPGEFTLLDGSRVQAEMMADPGLTVPYTTGPGFQAVELPYQAGSATMDIIVPNQGAFPGFEGSLDGPMLDQILGSMQPTSLHLQLPKFRFSSQFDLGARLASLGMTDAFDPNSADFSGMTGARDLFINKVLHQASVVVDEQGTEAAAATSVIMSPTMALRATASLTVDRPFIFLIRDAASGQILFMGRVLDPTQP